MDPISLFGITSIALTKLFSDKGFDMMVSGFVGNRIDAAGCYLLGDVWDKTKKLWAKDELPRNADLIRAIKQSKLKATDFLVKIVKAHAQDLSKLNDDDGIAEEMNVFSKAFTKWYQTETNDVNVLQDLPHNDPSYKKIELLLSASEGSSITALRDQLRKEAKDALVQELKNGLYIVEVPELFIDMLYNGWQSDEKTFDWFDVMTLHFSDILKDKKDERPSKAFQDRLLSDIKVELNDFNSALGELAGLKTFIQEKGKQIDTIEAGQKIILNKLLELQKDVKDISLVNLEKAPEIKTLLETIAALYEEKNAVREEWDSCSKALETDPANKWIQKSFTATKSRLREVSKLLVEAEQHFTELKYSIVQTKAYLDTIDMEKASERLKQAKSRFEGGDFKGVKDILDFEGRDELLQQEISNKQQQDKHHKNLADEAVLLALNLLKESSDTFRFEKAKQNFEYAVSLFPCYDNYFEYAYFLAGQNKHHLAIHHYTQSLAFVLINEEDKRATILNNLAILLRDVQQYEAARKHFEEALALNRKLAAASSDTFEPDVAMTLNNLASLFRTIKQYEAARKHYEEALAIRRKLAAASPDAFEPDVATTLNNLANLFGDIQQHKAALKHYEEALDINRKLAAASPDASEPDVAMTLNNLAILFRAMNQYEAAQKHYEEALVIQRKLAVANPTAFEPDVAWTLNNLGNLFGDIDQYEAAQKHFEEALAIRRKLAAASPDAFEPDVATTLNNMANLFYTIQQYEAARKHYEEALAIHRKLAAASPDAFEPDVATTLNNMANLFYTIQQYKAARKHYEEALAILRKLAAASPDAFEPDVARTLNNLAILFCNIQQYEDARNHFEEALVIRRKLAAASPDAFKPTVAITLNNMANLFYTIQLYDIAAKHYEEALIIFRILAAASPNAFESDVAKTLNNLANLFDDIKQYEDARKHYAEALVIHRKLAAASPDVFEPDVAITLNNMAILLDNIRQYEAARKHYEEALSMFRKYLPNNPAVYNTKIEDIEEALRKLDKLDELDDE